MRRRPPGITSAGAFGAQANKSASSGSRAETDAGAEAEGRQQELAIRVALGASSRQIAGELLMESVFLGVLGGAAGLGFAYAALRLLVALAPAYLPRLENITIRRSRAAVQHPPWTETVRQPPGGHLPERVREEERGQHITCSLLIERHLPLEARRLNNCRHANAVQIQQKRISRGDP